MSKAILLLSGGLDSTLAGKLLLKLGVEVEALNFTSPFCNCTPRTMGCSAAKVAAGQLGINVRVKSCGEDYLAIMKRPRFGRGSGMNACVDCRIHLFAKAGEYMRETGAEFIATGEVLDERPMSQRRKTMDIIERESGLSGLVVRPLCAHHLPPSTPEISGLIDREQLMAIRGRSRRPQMELARELDVKDYLCPAGGCLLTDKEFAARFRELLEKEPDFTLHDARTLRYGRHFRLPSGAKVVVGRREEENASVERSARDEDFVLVPRSTTGPSVMLRGDSPDVKTAAGLLASYIKHADAVDVEVRKGDSSCASLLPQVAPLDHAVFSGWRIGA